MTTPNIPNSTKFTTWRKSTRSGSADSNCVEVAVASDGTIGLRDSKHQAGPVLEFEAQAFALFLDAVRQGEFDQPRA